MLYYVLASISNTPNTPSQHLVTTTSPPHTTSYSLATEDMHPIMVPYSVCTISYGHRCTPYRVPPHVHPTVYRVSLLMPPRSCGGSQDGVPQDSGDGPIVRLAFRQYPKRVLLRLVHYGVTPYNRVGVAIMGHPIPPIRVHLYPIVYSSAHCMHTPLVGV
jgi:hypothetical protein